MKVFKKTSPLTTLSAVVIQIILLNLISQNNVHTQASIPKPDTDRVASLQREISESLKSLDDAIRELTEKLAQVTALKLQLEASSLPTPVETTTNINPTDEASTQSINISPSPIDSGSSAPLEQKTDDDATSKATTISTITTSSPKITTTSPAPQEEEGNLKTTPKPTEDEISPRKDDNVATSPAYGQESDLDPSLKPTPTSEPSALPTSSDPNLPPTSSDSSSSSTSADPNLPPGSAEPSSSSTSADPNLPPTSSEPSSSSTSADPNLPPTSSEPSSSLTSADPNLPQTSPSAEIPNTSPSFLADPTNSGTSPIPVDPPAISPANNSQIDDSNQGPVSPKNNNPSPNDPVLTINTDSNTTESDSCQIENEPTTIPYTLTRYTNGGMLTGFMIQFGNILNPDSQNQVSPSVFQDGKKFSCILKNVLAKSGIQLESSQTTPSPQSTTQTPQTQYLPTPPTRMNLNLNNVDYKNEIFSGVPPSCELKKLEINGGRCTQATPLPASLESLEMQNVRMDPPTASQMSQSIRNCERLQRLKCTNIPTQFSMADIPSQNLQSLSMQNTGLNYSPNVNYPRCKNARMDLRQPNRNMANQMDRIFPNLQNAMIQGNNPEMVESAFKAPNLQRMCFPSGNYGPGQFRNPVLNNAVESCGENRQSRDDYCQMRRNNRDRRWVTNTLRRNEIGEERGRQEYPQVNNFRQIPRTTTYWGVPGIVFPNFD